MPYTALHGKRCKKIVLQHGERTADTLLAWLKDEIHRAVEVARLRQIARGTEQHRGVTVMAACVHLSRIAAAICEVVGLRDRQRIHVGAQPDRRLTISGTQHAHHTGAADAAVHLDAPFYKFLRNQIGGAMFLKAEFRMGMDVPSYRGQFGVVAADLFYR